MQILNHLSDRGSNFNAPKKDNFTDDEWNNLYKLSEETFVEESDSLKEGAAGAGLTDND